MALSLRGLRFSTPQVDFFSFINSCLRVQVLALENHGLLIGTVNSVSVRTQPVDIYSADCHVGH